LLLLRLWLLGDHILDVDLACEPLIDHFLFFDELIKVEDVKFCLPKGEKEVK
jgi:hypothetical protein